MLGVGTDILKISNLGPGTLTPDDIFVRKTYTPNEIDEAAKREVPMYYFATRFAGKEAVFKALNVSTEFFNLTEIEILSDEKGQPHVTLYGKLAKKAQEQGIGKVLISLSYDTDYAIAYASAVQG